MSIRSIKYADLPGVEDLKPLVSRDQLNQLEPGEILHVRVTDADYDYPLAPSKYCDCWSGCKHRRKKVPLSKLIIRPKSTLLKIKDLPAH